MMRWWWFGPSVTKPQLEREMRLMKEGGIGGFEVQPVYPLALDDAKTGIRTLPFLSTEFLDALRFTSEKARELGLRMDLTLGSGWPFGGPTVPVAEAAGKLRVERIKLAQSQWRVKLPDIGGGEKLIAVFLVRMKDQNTVDAVPREITDIRDGAVSLPLELEGLHELQVFIASRTGQQVKRPAIGGEGFVLDHLNRGAIENYLRQVGDRLMEAFGSTRPHAIFCDSLEVYGNDWTDDLLEEFHKRRLYNLKGLLPALVADMGPKTESIRRDWGKTLTELLNERFLAPMKEWTARNGTLFRIQDYGVPAAVLSSNSFADLPEGEGAAWKTLSATRWASSASHIYGRGVTSSETWTWLHSPAFMATPLDLKAEADVHFLQGINQLIGHGWPYTAQGVEYPGWRFYAAGVYNEKNPWWIVMPDLARYLQRVSYLLRQGRPRADVAIYLPNDDAWSQFTPGNIHMIEILRKRLGPDLIPQLLASGFNFDFFDDESLSQTGGVERGSLVLGANKYRVVILPNTASVPARTLQQLEEFAYSGGVLVATRQTPSRAPGARTTEKEHRNVADFSERLFKGSPSVAHFVQDEKADLSTVLQRLIAPDVLLSPRSPEVGFVHRSFADGEIYFLANTGNSRVKTTATFRLNGLDAEWWDPLTGGVRRARVAGRGAEATSLDLELEPYESRVLVFSRRSGESTRVEPSLETSGEIRPTVDLSEGWQVTFDGNGPVRRLDKLRSWTDDADTRYYSGSATYERVFVLPDKMLGAGVRVRLDLGESRPSEETTQDPRAHGIRARIEGPIREAAVVWLNGRRVGPVWCPPWHLDVTGFLKSGENRLRIVVANTAINYMAGRGLPDYRLLNLRYGERFQPQDMDKVQPITSGLLGPIRLVMHDASKQ
jgi:hypothetical protein